MIDRVPGPAFDQAIENPQSAFSHPDDIATAGGLSAQEKLALLNRWQQDVTERPHESSEQKASDDLLQEIAQAIQTVNAMAAGSGEPKFG